MRRGLSSCLNFIYFVWALVVLFVEWGWHPLSELLVALTRFAWVGRVEQRIERLAPYPALTLFLLPLGVLVPVKIFALWMVLNGEVVAALAFVLLAKVLTTAVVARTFKLTKDKILHIRWFARFYDWFAAWKHHAFQLLRTSVVWQISRDIKTIMYARASEVLAWVRLNR